MSLHVGYDHQCASCGADYIPYDAEVACPICGKIESERFDFVPEVVESLMFNKAGGSYLPAAWYIGDISDHILHLLFHLFDAYEKSGIDNFRQFAMSWLPKLDWEDQEYICQYVLELAVRVHEELQHQPNQHEEHIEANSEIEFDEYEDDPDRPDHWKTLWTENWLFNEVDGSGGEEYTNILEDPESYFSEFGSDALIPNYEDGPRSDNGKTLWAESRYFNEVDGSGDGEYTNILEDPESYFSEFGSDALIPNYEDELASQSDGVTSVL